MKTNEIITNQIIENLESAGSWIKNWQDLDNINLCSQKGYSGVNTLLLAQSKHKNNFNSGVWATYKQITEKGGFVKKGSKSTMIIFCTTFKNKEAQERRKVRTEEKKNNGGFMIRYYRVFNLDQTEGIEFELQGNDNKEIKSNADFCETYFKREHILFNSESSGRAYYNKVDDLVSVPTIRAFNCPENFYKTIFHEMIHSTGHKSRLDRFEEDYSHEEYSKEELVAELGALFLCAHVGIEPDIENGSAYIKSWIKVLKNDPQLIISASSKAQKAFDFIKEKK